MRGRLTSIAVAAVLLCGSAHAQAGAGLLGWGQNRSPAVSTQTTTPATPSVGGGWQCAPFARLLTGIQLFGDAGTWWSQAASKYARGFSPQAGSVLVFKPYGPMTRGHVAVVSQVLTDRIIQVTHANWSRINGARGQVEKDVTVVDVSQAGDWSQVKVWYDPTRNVGTTIYPTYGFVYKAAQAAQAAAARLADVLHVGIGAGAGVGAGAGMGSDSAAR